MLFSCFCPCLPAVPSQYSCWIPVHLRTPSLPSVLFPAWIIWPLATDISGLLCILNIFSPFSFPSPGISSQITDQAGHQPGKDTGGKEEPSFLSNHISAIKWPFGLLANQAVPLGRVGKKIFLLLLETLLYPVEARIQHINKKLSHSAVKKNPNQQ